MIAPDGKNATGKRPELREQHAKGCSLRISYTSKQILMEHAYKLSAATGRVVSLREALDDVIQEWAKETDSDDAT